LYEGFKNAIGAAQEAIIVTTPEVSSIRDADRVIGPLEASELHRPRLIINRINPAMVKRGDMMDQRDVVELLAVDILGLVPADDRTVTAAKRGVPVIHDKKAASGAAFLRIAAWLDGDDTPGHMSIMIDSQGQRGFILGDVLHNSVQVHETDWVSRADIDPEQTRSTRHSVMERLERDGSLVAAVHLPAPGFGRVVRVEGRRSWQAVLV